MTRSYSLVFITLLALGGCATTQPPHNPFKIPEAEFHGKIRTIALAPVQLPDGLEQPDPVKAKFETLVDAKLRAQGFAVVPSSEYTAVWKRMIEQLGGYFDPLTGKKDETKFKAVRTHSLRELNARFKADAVLHPAVRVVPARFSNNTASWDGVTDTVLAGGGGWQAIFAGPRQGTISALTFMVFIEDPNEVLMYSNGGGLQVANKLSGSTFILVPQNELFVDPERNQTAVNLALDALATAPTATPAAAGKN